MRRREFLTLLAGATAACSLAARAQQTPTKTRRVGMLMPVSAEAAAAKIEAIE